MICPGRHILKKTTTAGKSEGKNNLGQDSMVDFRRLEPSLVD